MYYTIQDSASHQEKIQRSSFHCFLFPVASVSEARGLISQHAKDYSNATHNCFAYIIGPERETQFCSDAGEPHGTAGKPILNSLLRNNLTNVLAIVTRYYGGVKLGVKGLIEAYGDSVENAVKSAIVIPSVLYCKYNINLDYAVSDSVAGKARVLGGEVIESVWEERVQLLVRIPAERVIEWNDFLYGLRQYNSIDYNEEK